MTCARSTNISAPSPASQAPQRPAHCITIVLETAAAPRELHVLMRTNQFDAAARGHWTRIEPARPGLADTVVYRDDNKQVHVRHGYETVRCHRRMTKGGWRARSQAPDRNFPGQVFVDSGLPWLVTLC